MILFFDATAPFKGPDNIYWLFSSAAQSIAAFIGFLAAGFFFMYDKLDKQVEKDETLESAVTELKHQFFSNLKLLLILTGFSIVLNLLTVYLNAFDNETWIEYFRVFVVVINLWTITAAIKFVINITDPKRFEKASNKLIKEDANLSTGISTNASSVGHFLMNFIQLERKARLLYYSKGNSHPLLRIKNPTLPEIFREFVFTKIISDQNLYDLLELNKIRNLAAHGNLTNIDNSQLNKLASMNDLLQRKLDELTEQGDNEATEQLPA